MSDIHYGFSTPLSETGVPPATPDGEVLTNGIWFNEYGQQTLRGYNLATGSLDVSEVAPWGLMTFYHAWTQLTATGSTTEINVEDYHHHTIQVVVAALAGGESCVVRVEGTLDGTNWFNLAAADTTYNANGTYMLEYDSLKLKYIRFTFVTDSASGAVTLDPDYFGGN